MGYGMGYGWGFLGGVLSLTVLIWFVVFTVLVLNRLDKIIELLSKKS